MNFLEVKNLLFSIVHYDNDYQQINLTLTIMVSLKGGSALGTSTWSRIGWFIPTSTCLLGGNFQAPAPKAGTVKGRLELI